MVSFRAPGGSYARAVATTYVVLTPSRPSLAVIDARSVAHSCQTSAVGSVVRLVVGVREVARERVEPGAEQEAVALCKLCSAGLCLSHLQEAATTSARVGRAWRARIQLAARMPSVG